MRKVLTVALLAAIGVLPLGGCSQGILDTKWGIEETARKNSAAMQRIQPGMALNEVVRTMDGEPYLAESYKGKNGERILVYKYITNPAFDLGAIKDDDLTPCIFVNDVFEGLGWAYLETASRKYEFVAKARSG